MAKFNLKLGDDVWLLDLGTMKISEAEQCESMTGWDVEVARLAGREPCPRRQVGGVAGAYSRR